jgi:hypothetical protein
VYKENPLRTNDPTFSFVIYNCRSGPLHRWRSLGSWHGAGAFGDRRRKAGGHYAARHRIHVASPSPITAPPGIESTLHRHRRSLRRQGSRPCCIADHCASHQGSRPCCIADHSAARYPIHVASPLTSTGILATTRLQPPLEFWQPNGIMDDHHTSTPASNSSLQIKMNREQVDGYGKETCW